MRTLYIGRFQPFHNGHRKVLDLMRRIGGEIVFGIGDIKNPEFFTLSERESMIRANGGGNIVSLDDLSEKDPLYLDWGRYVLNLVGSMNLVGSVDLVATGNERVRDDFLVHSIPVLWLPRYGGISGTMVRNKIIQRNSSWRELVPEESAKVIEHSGFYGRYNS